MISKYSFGKPFETEALVVRIEATEDKLPFFRLMEKEIITMILMTRILYMDLVSR